MNPHLINKGFNVLYYREGQPILMVVAKVGVKLLRKNTLYDLRARASSVVGAIAVAPDIEVWLWATLHQKNR